jgi:hypothetical protein
MTEPAERGGIGWTVVVTLAVSGAKLTVEPVAPEPVPPPTDFDAEPKAPLTDFDASDEEKQARLLRAYAQDERLDEFKLALRLDEYDEVNRTPAGRPEWVIGPTVVKWARDPSDGTGLSEITFDFGQIAFGHSVEIRGLAILDDKGRVAGKTDNHFGAVESKSTWHLTFHVYAKRITEVSDSGHDPDGETESPNPAHEDEDEDEDSAG